MKSKCKIVNLDLDYITHKPKLTIQVDDLNGYDEIKDLEELEITLDKPKRKRGLSQNSYCWLLLQKLADKLDTTKVDIYREFIKDKGIFRTFTIDNDAISTFKTVWENMGIGWICEILKEGDKQSEVIAYYGTSVYNSKQMSVFVDYVVSECENQGIETMTPNEIAMLKIV